MMALVGYILSSLQCLVNNSQLSLLIVPLYYIYMDPHMYILSLSTPCLTKARGRLCSSRNRVRA